MAPDAVRDAAPDAVRSMTDLLPHYLLPLGDGVYAIDTGYPRDQADAAYLLVHHGRAAFIDTGTNHSVPRLLGALDALGLAREAVDWVIPTHVHLDHAGGLGLLVQQLPQAQVLVHPRGARHLIDPTALYEGALAVYGQAEMARSYGRLVAVAAERVHTSCDGQRLELAGRELGFIHTEGHARHHHCIWDATTRGWFTGDTFGLSYREFDAGGRPWIFPTSSPAQFEPVALKASVARLLAAEPECIYLTHFSRVRDVQRLGASLVAQIDDMVSLAERLGRQGLEGAARHRALLDGLWPIYERSLAEHDATAHPEQVRAVLGMDVDLNAMGLAMWLDQRAARAARGAA